MNNNMYNYKEKILITGGVGFIGSHITDELINQGYNVIIADNLSGINSGYRNDKAKYININILDEKFENIFIEYKPDFCIHLAAQVSVPVGTQDPYFDAEQNILGSIKVIQYCKKYNVKNY